MSWAYKYHWWWWRRQCLTTHYWTALNRIFLTNTQYSNYWRMCIGHLAPFIQTIPAANLSYVSLTYICHAISHLCPFWADPSARLQAAAEGWLPICTSSDSNSPLCPAWSETTPIMPVHVLACSQHGRHFESEHMESMTPAGPLLGMGTPEQSGISKVII
jgi:hypothetical protein